jgi:hypothetical protein
MNTSHAYIILGTAGSGRRAVLADLIANGLADTDRPVLLTARSETAAEAADAQRLTDTAHLVQQLWALEESRVVTEPLPDGATHVFILVDGRTNPVDQIEAIHGWLPSAGLEIGRVITVVNCQLASTHPELARWFDACVHFSDVVLLNRREGVTNKWVSDFTARYKKQSFPCLFESVKKGVIENPAVILEPEARRISMLFDPEDAWPLPVDKDTVIEDENGEEAPPSAEDLADPDLIGKPDPYIDRLYGSGRRAKEIPDIAKILG